MQDRASARSTKPSCNAPDIWAGPAYGQRTGDGGSEHNAPNRSRIH
jgi:hypothetical protein